MVQILVEAGEEALNAWCFAACAPLGDFFPLQLKKAEMGQPQPSAADLEAQQQMQLLAMQHALGQQMVRALLAATVCFLVFAVVGVSAPPSVVVFQTRPCTTHTVISQQPVFCFFVSMGTVVHSYSVGFLLWRLTPRSPAILQSRYGLCRRIKPSTPTHPGTAV